MNRFTLLMAVTLGCVAFTSDAQSDNHQKKSLSELVQMADMLDNMDFQEQLRAAQKCTASRDFLCAEQHLQRAETYVNNAGQQSLLHTAHRQLQTEKQQVQREKEVAARMARAQREAEAARQAQDARQEPVIDESNTWAKNALSILNSMPNTSGQHVASGRSAQKTSRQRTYPGENYTVHCPSGTTSVIPIPSTYSAECNRRYKHYARVQGCNMVADYQLVEEEMKNCW